MFYSSLFIERRTAPLLDAGFILGLKWIVGLAILSGLFCIAYAVYYWKFISGRNKATIDKCKRWIAIGVALCLIMAGAYALFIYFFYQRQFFL